MYLRLGEILSHFGVEFSQLGNSPRGVTGETLVFLAEIAIMPGIGMVMLAGYIAEDDLGDGVSLVTPQDQVKAPARRFLIEPTRKGLGFTEYRGKTV